MQVVSRLLRVSLGTILVVKQTQLEASLSFGRLLNLCDSILQNLGQVLQCDDSLAVGTVNISKHSVRFTLLVTVVISNTEFKELLQIFNCVIVVIRGDLLLNQSNLLVALSFLVLVVGTLGHVEALFKESKGQVVFGFLAILDGDELVNAHQIARDVSRNRIEHAFDSLFKGSFKVAHSLALVQNSFFTNAEAFECFSLALNILELRGDLKAALVEITGGFEILKLLVNISH